MNQTVSGTLNAQNQSRTYTFTLDEGKTVQFDRLNSGAGNDNLYWSLTGPYNTSLASSEYLSTGTTAPSTRVLDLPPGTYTLQVYTSGFGNDSYAFRLLDQSTATPLTNGQIVEGRVEPSGEMVAYSVDAEAGDRLFVDFRDLTIRTSAYDATVGFSHYNYTGGVRIVDPYGRDVTSAALGDAEAVATVSGRYTVLLDNYQNYNVPVAYRLAVFVNTPGLPRTIDLGVTATAMDLQVQSVAVTPAQTGSDIRSGNTMTVSWTTLNNGVSATLGDFVERVIVRRPATGEVVAQVSMPFVEADPGNGSLLPSQTVARQVNIRLPDGPAGAGDLSVTVETDVTNTQPEGGVAEENNRAFANFTSALADYPNLVAANLSIAPTADWSAGQPVTVRWTTRNDGSLAATGGWTERVELLNQTTGVVVANLAQAFTAQNIAAGSSADRSASFNWPSGLNAIGAFRLRVVVDALSEVSEYNASGALENDNAKQQVVSVGPDLVVRNPGLLQTGVQSGDRVTLVWEDVNQGSVPTPVAYQDRVVVRQRNADGTAGAVILDTSVAFAGAAALPLQPGEARARSLNFALPDGVLGSGQFDVFITADSSASGTAILFETNLAGNAETNNTSAGDFITTLRQYADLAVTDLVAPTTVESGAQTQISWSVTNQGPVAAVSANGSWVDRVVLSSDSVIGNADDVILASVTHTGALAVGASYGQSASVRIPTRLQGNYRIAVISDINSAVREPDTRADNLRLSGTIAILQTYADLVPSLAAVPAEIFAGRTARVEWSVQNNGTVTTDVSRWVDQVYLSSTPSLSASSILLGSVTHVGALDRNGSYAAAMDVQIPRDASGPMYFIVKTDAFAAVYELGRTPNNVVIAAASSQVQPEPRANFVVQDLTAPTQWRVGSTVELTYTVRNTGNDPVNSWLAEEVRLVDTGNASNIVTLGSPSGTRNLAQGAAYTQTLSYTVPAMPAGNWRLEVIADRWGYVSESSEADNVGSASIAVVHPDLVVSQLATTGLRQGGETLTLNWTTRNSGTADASHVRDAVYLSRDGVVGAGDTQLGEITHTSLGAGASEVGQLSFTLPVDLEGDWRLIVVTDATNQNNENTSGEANNADMLAIAVARDFFADLAVSAVQAPTRVIDDPASVTVEWTVTNMGTGLGRTLSWTDRVIYSQNDVLGDSDDIVLGNLERTGGLAVGDSYNGSVTYRFGPGVSRHGRVFVRTDAAGAVWENTSEANNTAAAPEAMDVMPIPYADLQVESVTTPSDAFSGRPITVTWTVVNRGIGITDAGSWSDNVWLSSNPDGTGTRWNLGSGSHNGQLAPAGRYTRSMQVTLPEGISGNYYLNVSTGGPFEFIYTDNNQASSVSVPVALSPSPDLLVEAINAPATSKEGALVDLSWTVINQGEARAAGQWTDTVVLVPASGTGSAVVLGTFTYDRGLDSGIRYTRTEQVRLPSKIEGSYRLRVVTNSALGSSSSTQVYEHGSARSNNTTTAGDVTEVSLNPRPDLHVSAVVAPTESVTAGTTASVRFTVTNMGPEATSGQWQDYVYLSLDGILSGDDVLAARLDSGAALAPSESYTTQTAAINIPIRFRGDVYMIISVDAPNRIDEYPNEGNNVKAEKFHVDPIPFADLVTSDVVAPDQLVHGATVGVTYKVTNSGAARSQGDTSAVNSWTDSVWLTVDKRRPSPSKGDILLGQVTHTGNLSVGEDYLGSIQGQIPDNVRSGQYYITVWSDTYDAILEDTLASNINPDDAGQIDNNNYKARAVSVLGMTPPDLVVSQATATPAVTAPGDYSFSYTVKNQGDLFNGAWTDRVWVADNADLSRATTKWMVGEFNQQRSLGNGETYSVSQTVQLAPSVKGAYLVVETDRPYNPGYAYRNDIAELDESNNARAVASNVDNRPSDLRVASIVTEPENFSGEETTIIWTVTNFGADVWSGTRGWVDSVYFSPDPEFIPNRATALGALVHSNAAGLASGASYTASARFKLPPGTNGPYYIYVITDSSHPTDGLSPAVSSGAMSEDLRGENNAGSRDFLYAYSVFEGARNDNNRSRGTLNVTYREPDLQIDSITSSDPNPASGDTITVSWTVTNRGTRETRVPGWFDGVFLSRDTSMDPSDYPVVDRGNEGEMLTRLRQTYLTDAEGKPRYLKPGESYTNSTTFTLPSSISGNFSIIVKADTSPATPWGGYGVVSTVREGLRLLADAGAQAGSVLEFQDEGNNVSFMALPISLSPPPDLQVTQVTAPNSVIAGQALNISYTVENKGGKTPADQGSWYDLIYLSKDRFLDINKDRYLGYVSHGDGLPAGGSYDSGTLSFTAPRDLEGPYYVFVVTDPARAWGSGDNGRVYEFGKDDNNNAAAVQPVLIEVPPPADLVVTNVVVPSSVSVGQEVEITFTVTNQSTDPALGRWTDALYLSSDNTWDLNDQLLGKVAHAGDLAGNGTYTATLKTTLPALKDGAWRVIVRPDLYNEVFEGKITYNDTGLHIPPGEANNRLASAATLNVTVPTLTVGAPLATTLTTGNVQIYKLSVAAGETLRVNLDSVATDGASELYVRYGDIPTGYAFDAAYSKPVSPDQEVLIPTTKAGDYYVLVRARQAQAGTAATLRADLLPLSITSVTPDQGGVGDDDHRWVTVDIEGARFAAGALVKLSRPGVFEIEPERWQVLAATHIRAVFDLRHVPMGLYDISVINPDGQRVTEPYRYLVERAIEADVTIGIGGARTINPGDGTTYSVTLQSLTNVDTPYVRFDVGASDMGNSQNLLEGLNLPYVVFSSNVGGQPGGATSQDAGNTQSYGATPTTPIRSDIPWASLDGADNTSGWNLAPGYAFDVAAGGFVGFSFNVQTYPGLAEWLAYDFEGLRSKLYAIRPDWKAQGLLDGGIPSLNNISPGLAAKFVSTEPGVHITKLEALAMPFRFDTLGAATPLTRDEFIADQTAHAKQLRTAILADASAPSTLAVLAADEAQWVQGWLAALEASGLLRPADEAPPIRLQPQVMSLNATLATGILLSKGGESYRTQADLLGFFTKVQQWYGDTARWAGDPIAAHAPVDYSETRHSDDGGEVEVPVPVAPKPADYDQHATQDTHFISFDVFAGGTAELEYLRHIGVLDEKFGPVGPQALNLTQYLQQAAQRAANAQVAVSVQGPQTVLTGGSTSYVPADYALPYTVSFSNPTEHPVGELRIVTELDADLDPRSLRLNDLKIGDINIHVPGDQAVFQGDFDFSGNKGFVLRVSAGIDAQTRIATWLIKAIDPDTGEVLHDATRGLLLPDASGKTNKGYVSYTVRASAEAVTGASISSQARAFFDDAPPIDSGSVSHTLDASAPVTQLTVTSVAGSSVPTYTVGWKATDDASGVKHVTVYVSENGGDFRIWRKQVAGDASQVVFTGEAGKSYEFLAAATDNAGNREAAVVSNAVLPDDGSRQKAEQALGANDTLTGTAELPAAAPGRSYVSNEIFQQATLRLPGFVAPAQPGDLQSVLAPMTVRGFADGFTGSDGDIGALAMVQLSDGSVLASAGSLRNEVFKFGKDGGHTTTPLFVLDSPVLDMAVDALGQLWVMTGRELLLVDATTGAVIDRHIGPGQDPLTHALAIDPDSGLIYVSSGNGVEIFDPKATDASKAWKHFSNSRVGDLAFGPDGRLWGVRWTGSDITDAVPGSTTEIISFPMAGRTQGRAEVEYRIAGVVDSIAFGAAGSPLAGVMLASSNLAQRPVVQGAGSVPHTSSVWMVELQSRRVLQLATGGTRGESLLTTSDGIILIAQTGHIDQISPIHAPSVLATSVAEGALLPLPVSQIAVTFDQAMWTGSSGMDADDLSSVLNASNYSLIATGANSNLTLQPVSVRWDAGSRSAVLTLPNLPAGGWRLEINPQMRSAAQVRLSATFITTFTAVSDLTSLVNLVFTNTRADRLTGEVSYDVSITNIGVDDIRGPLTLLLDPGRYFANQVVGATQGTGDQADLWLIDLTAGLQATGGKLGVGATLANQTVSVRPASIFGTSPGSSTLVKFNLGHGIYAVPYDNTPPTVQVAGAADPESVALPDAQAGQAWTGTLQADDSDGATFFWQILQGPAGLTIAQSATVDASATGYSNTATLSWTPTARDRADTEVLVRVVDSRGGVAIRRFTIAVAGANHVPVLDGVGDITLAEGQTLQLPIVAADADGDTVTVSLRNLPAGARYDAATGILTWVPGYDQAGDYPDVTIVASDGKHTVS